MDIIRKKLADDAIKAMQEEEDKKFFDIMVEALACHGILSEICVKCAKISREPNYDLDLDEIPDDCPYRLEIVLKLDEGERK